MTRSLLLCLLLSGLLTEAAGQSLYIAPAETEADRVRRLVAGFAPQPLTLELRLFGRGDTNVLPLATGAERHAPQRTFAGSDAYFTAYRNEEIALSRGAWRLSYAWTRADLYQGNRDAGQLYLDSLSDTIDPAAVTRPVATMNRTAALRWRAGYTAPFVLARRRGALTLAASYLRMQRVQLGEMAGDTRGNHFEGTLSFLSTLDLPPAETRSAGLSLDAGLALELSDRWRVSLACDNLLGRIWQRGLQKIEAEVRTNTIVADGDGFLHSAPLLEGRVSRRDLQTDLRRRFDLGVACRQGRRDWLFFLRQDFDWRAAAGLTQRMGRGGRWWALAWLAPFEWQAGCDWGPWRAQLGMSELDTGSARRATLSLAWRIPLERSRSPRPDSRLGGWSRGATRQQKR